jgi:hypothetical protein
MGNSIKFRGAFCNELVNVENRAGKYFGRISFSSQQVDRRLIPRAAFEDSARLLILHPAPGVTALNRGQILCRGFRRFTQIPKPNP